MSKTTKFINTIETLESGSIMQDNSGFFFRPKGASGLHKPGRDGEHMPSLKDVKQSLKAASAAPGKPAPTKPAPQGLKPQPRAEAQAKTAQVKAEVQPQAKSSQEAPQAKEPPQVIRVTELAQEAEHLRNEVERLRLENEQLKAGSVAPGNASKVRHKVVEASGPMGLHFWLYAGYEHVRGFKWNGSGGFMFLTMEALENFLRANGIGGTIEVETVDVTNGNYDPNKGVIPNDDANGQRRLL